jgi:hypothetical protein
MVPAGKLSTVTPSRATIPAARSSTVQMTGWAGRVTKHLIPPFVERRKEDLQMVGVGGNPRHHASEDVRLLLVVHRK